MTKAERYVSNKITWSLVAIQTPGRRADSCEMVHCHITIALVDEALDQARLQREVNYAPLTFKRVEPSLM